MSGKKIRVLVVDDSPVIRRMLSDRLNEVPDIEVFATAGDGEEALELIAKDRPDVVTLDVHMPRMDGLQLLDHLLATTPLPVIVVSSATQRSADVTLNALERGAVDYVAKPVGKEELQRVLTDELPRKIRIAANTDVRRLLDVRKRRKERTKSSTTNALSPKTDALNECCIAIAVSTGGPPALTSLFQALHPPLPAILVVQHMPDSFTKPFADRLNRLSPLDVSEAGGGEVLRPNTVLIAPGGRHMQIRRRHGSNQAHVFDAPPVSGHRPSADVMMSSAATVYESRCLGVIMTGMGRDGVDGCAAIRAAGGLVLGQDEESSDVYGMNRVAFIEGHVDRQIALDDIPDAIVQATNRMCFKRRSPTPATREG